MKKIYFTCLLIFTSLSFSNAQQISIPEEIRAKCPDIPLNERVRVTVSDFAYSAGGDRGRTLENFAAMLSNALFNINCYRVLSMLKDDDQLEGGGRVLKPQIVVTGEITEYSHETKSSNVIIATKKEVTAHIGYILQVKNTFTGDILFSESRNMDGSSSNSSMKMTVRSPIKILGRTRTGTIGSSEEGDNIKAAYQDALEKAIIEAVTILVDKNQRILIDLEGNTEEDLGYAQQANVAESWIKVTGASFQKLSELEAKLKGSSWVQEIQKKLSSGVGTLNILHTGNQDDLLTVVQSFGSLFEIVGVEDAGITVKESK